MIINFVPSNSILCRFARAAATGNDYFILLIITDGIITDMPQTTEAIVNVSRLVLNLSLVSLWL